MLVSPDMLMMHDSIGGASVGFITGEVPYSDFRISDDCSE